MRTRFIKLKSSFFGFHMDARERAKKERSRQRFERHRLYRAAYPKRAASAARPGILAEDDVQEYVAFLEQVRRPHSARDVCPESCVVADVGSGRGASARFLCCERIGDLEKRLKECTCVCAEADFDADV